MSVTLVVMRSGLAKRTRHRQRTRRRVRSLASLRVVASAGGGELDPCSRAEQLVRSGGELRRVLCSLAARFAAVRGWERIGYARLGDYAVERLGVSARSLQDWAHVESALRELRGLEAALVSGELGWTKVRLLARVATPGDESAWLRLADRATATELAREVRAVDLGANAQPGSAVGDVQGSEEGAREAVTLVGSHMTRVAWRRCHRLARRVSGQPVPMWQAMEWVAAETLSSLPLEGDVVDADSPRAPVCSEVLLPRLQRLRPVQREVAPAMEAVALRADLARLLDGIESADAFALDRRLRAAVTLERRLEARVAPLLLRVFEGRLFRSHSDGRAFSSFESYAVECLGFSARRARMLLRVARTARRCSDFESAWRSGALSWVKAHELVPVVTLNEGRDAARWIAWARRVTVRRLREDVARAVDSDAMGCPPEEVGERERQTGAEHSATETSRFTFPAPTVVARLFKATVCRTRKHLEKELGRPTSEDDALRAMFAHFRDVWDTKRVPKRHAVFERDGWRCTVPGCTSYRELHDHHIRYRSRGGGDSLANRTTLCVWHHLRGEHAGRIRVSGTAPGELHFELGLREGRPALAGFSGSEVSVRAF